MIYGVDGQFGSGKTSYVVWLASQNPNSMIFTNIKMNTIRLKNIYKFEDNELLSIFRTQNLINDMERQVFDLPIKDSDLMYHPRHMFTRCIFALDEAGALLNSREWSKNMEEHRSEYINQNRKNFLDIYLCSADGSENDKSLRKFVQYWFYSEPFLNFPILNQIKVIRKQEREVDGKTVKTKKYTGMDLQGDLVMKEKPIDSYETWYWAPSVWKLYDDLHKNIRDPNKYTSIRWDFVRLALKRNRYLGKAIKKKNQFGFMLDEPELFTIDEERQKRKLLLKP